MKNKHQHNTEFEQLFYQKLDMLEADYRQAQTPKEKAEVLRSHGFDIKDFYRFTIRATNERLVKMGVPAHLQRSADFLNLGRSTIHDNQNFRAESTIVRNPDSRQFSKQ